MPHTTPPRFRKNLLTLAVIAALTPSVTLALELVQSPPLPTSKSAYAAPNVIISIDDSGSMLFCSNRESSSACPTTIDNSSRTVTTAYSCASGYSKDASDPPNCYKTNNSERTRTYSCTNGYTLSGSNCKKNGSTNNTYRVTTYSCSNGTILDSSNNCVIIDNTQLTVKITYTCPSNLYKNPTTNDCYNTTAPSDEESPPWQGSTKRINVLKYALESVFRDPELIPDGKIRLAWQSLNNTGASATRAGNVNSPTVQKTYTMRPLKGEPDTDGTHRSNFIKFVKGLNPSGSTPSHKMFSQADAYLRADLDKNGPWSTDPGGTGSKSNEYLGCRRNYHIMMTDGRWNGNPTPLPDLDQRDNATDLSIGGGAATYTGTDSALYRDESTGTTLADWAFYSWAQPLKTSGLSDKGEVKPSLAYEEAPDTETFASGENTVTLKKFWNPKYNPATWPHMVTHTIGFSELAYKWNHAAITAPTEMAPFGYDGSFPELASGSTPWPDLTGSTESKNALDLWHAALNGRGRFYAVEEGEELETAFRDIIGKINEESAELPEKISPGGTSSGYNTSQNNAGLFASLYNAKLGWSGSITATPARAPEEYACPTEDDPEAKCMRFPNPIAEWEGKTTAELLDERATIGGQIGDRLILSWSDKWAGSKPTGGVSFEWATNDSKLSTAQKALLGVETAATGATVATRGENILNFIRGDRNLEAAAPTTPPTPANPAKPFRTRTSRQGDIVNSEIWYTGSPASRTTLSGYSSFISTYKDREPMLYVGGNDGMLHGFSAKNGQEKLAYVPRGVIADLYKLADTDYEHQYYVDGSPMTGDVQDGTAWKTMLVGTLGAGGKGYFVLDVTNPAGFSAASASTLVALDNTRGNKEAAPVCASLSGTEKDACTAAATENADIGNIVAQPVRNPADLQETTQITRMNNGRWAAVLGNGYNSANERPVLLVQYLDGDKELKRIQTTDQDKGVGNAKDNGLAAPALVDLNGDGKTDVVYAGDNLGNLWKFDLTSDTDSEWAVAFGNNKPLFTARGPVALGDTRNQVQPVTAPPIVRDNDRSMTIGEGTNATTVAIGGMSVAFGTGRNLTASDRRTDMTQNVQTLYSVLDNTRYRKKSGKDHLEVHPGTGDCEAKPATCVPTPAALGTLDSAGKLLAKQTIADIPDLDGYQTVDATDELTKETWKKYKGWYMDMPAKGERLLTPMQFWDGSNILAMYTAAPSGTKSTSSDNINESCVDVKIDTSAGSQYRTLINIMDGKVPSIPLVDATGDGVFDGSDKSAARLSVNTGSPLLITTTKNIMDYTGVGADVTKAVKGARMPEQSMRPSWRQLK